MKTKALEGSTLLRVVVVGTDPLGNGGVASVLHIYQQGGLDKRVDCRFLVTHRDGSGRSKLLVFFKALTRLITWLWEGHGEILHIHTSSRVSFYRKSVVALLGRLWGRKIILHVHSGEFMQFYHKECGSFAKAYVRVVFSLAHVTIVLANQWVTCLKEIVPENRLRVLHNPILLPPTPPDPTNRDQNRLLFLGRMGVKKGLWDLLEVMARLVPGHVDLVLHIGGDGDVDAVRARIQALELTRHVQLEGWLRGPEKLNLMRSASIYLLPSYYEGLPMGVLEAMSWGMAVVASRVGGVEDAIPHASMGLCIQPGNLDQLEAALRSLLENPPLRRSMGLAARRHVENTFSCEIILDQLLTIYRECFEGSAKR